MKMKPSTIQLNFKLFEYVWLLTAQLMTNDEFLNNHKLKHEPTVSRN